MGCLNFFYKIDGYDDKVDFEFSQNFKPERNRDPHDHKFQTTIRGLKISMNEDLIIQVNEIPRGKTWDKDDHSLNLIARTSFFRTYENYEENRNGIKRESCLEN